MKKYILLFFIELGILLPSHLFAQDEGLSSECLKYLSTYTEYYKARNYDSAIIFWRKAFTSCPGNANQNMYVHGSTLLKQQIERTFDSAKRIAIIDTLLNIQDRRAEYYPKSRIKALNLKGQYIIDYRGNDSKFLFENLSVLISDLRGDADCELFVNCLLAAINLNKNGVLENENVDFAYNNISRALSTKSAKDEIERGAINNTKSKIEEAYKEWKETAQTTVITPSISKGHTMPSDKRIAVLEFNAGTGVSDTDVRGLSAIFTTFFKPSGYSLVERSQIDRILAEQSRQYSYITDSPVAEIGRLLNVSKIVIGDVNIIMNQYNVDLRLIDVETGEIVATEGASFKDDYRNSMKELANSLAESLSRTQQ